jgi:4-amino-4-deoxy-L-arabinose transferase-like glycosyltransferase
MDRRAALVFAICAAPRLLALAVFPDAAPTYYDALATSLIRTGHFGFDGVPSTYIEPLYPAFLAGARMITGDVQQLVLLLQIALASLGGVLLYRLGSWLANPRVGLYAAVFYALDPYLIRQSVALLDVTLCTTLAIAAAWQLSKMDRVRDAVAAGTLLGLLMLTRASFAAACLGAAIWLAWRGRGRLAGVMLAAVLVVQAPWMVRNARLDGSPLPSRIGENLYMSTSSYATLVPVHDIDLLVPLGLADVGTEVEHRQLPPVLEQRAIDQAMLERAFAFMREHPGRVLWLKARNALYLFDPRLLPRYAKSAAAFATEEAGVVRVFNEQRRPWVEELSYALARTVLMLLAAIGIVRRGIAANDAPLLILLATNAAVCVVFFPTSRLMAPVMFVVTFYAAAGLDALRATSGAARLRP